MPSDYPISTSDALLIRLTRAIRENQKVTFLLGSGLTSPSKDGKEKGVPDAKNMVERARALFTEPDELKLFRDRVDSSKPTKLYQAAMQCVIDCHGQTVLNSLIREAVMESRSSRSQNLTPEQINKDFQGWHLRPGVEAIGKLIRHYDQAFQRPILTSNFDPLIEIAIQRAGRGAITINLPNDGSFNSLILNDNIAQVVHFHGFWCQGDTLHTPDTLTKERPLLVGNLRLLLQETLLVVVGYGGWKDVFTDALIKAIGEQSPGLNILWAFFSKDEAHIRTEYHDLLEAFQSLPAQRVVLYAGVDCHAFFPKLLSKLNPLSSAIIPVRVTDFATANSLCIGTSSNPPTVDAWVGREDEISALKNSSAAVVSLNGFGGFGKSGLAARYVLTQEKEANPLDWYWADCKEQANTVQTHIVNLLEHLSRGEIKALTLQKARDQDILDLFFEKLRDNKILIIFDNIDHYIDLETQCAVGLLGELIQRALTVKHTARFVFTSRPGMHYDSSNFLSISVSGLSESDAEQLFSLRGAQLDSTKKAKQISSVHKAVQGSALSLNLIATQVAKQKISLDDLLLRIEDGTETEITGRILTEIWDTLDEHQQKVLRILAELPHPETEQQVGTCLSGSMNFNRFGKALKSLKHLNLVVVKKSSYEVDAIELHPLVKTFIVTRYPKEERAQTIEEVLGFFNRMILRLKGFNLTGKIDVLSHWIAKVEICAENDRIDEALQTFDDFFRRLLSLGLVEEFIRLSTIILVRYKAESGTASLPIFDSIIDHLTTVLGDLGRHDDVDRWAEYFSKTVTGKSARYILFCAIKSEGFWIRKDFEQAKSWAKEGVNLKSVSHLDTVYDCANHLALAQRDSKDVEPALNYFLQGEKLEKVLAPSEIDRGNKGIFYGNIGRCLQFMDKFDDALICLRKSAKSLEKTDASNILINRGYAALWLGEVLRELKKPEKAYISFRSAHAKWKVVSPNKAEIALKSAEALAVILADQSLAKCGDWECEEMYRGWLEEND